MMTVQEKALWHAIKQIQRRLRLSSGGFVPSAHADTHADGGTDELDVTDLAGYPGGSPKTYLDSDGNFTFPDLPPGSGDGNETYTAAYASRPAASNDGDLFLPSNGFVVERDTGAAWVPWGPIFPFTTPVDGSFAWVNQGGASVSTTNGGIFLSGPATAGDSLRCRTKARPADPTVAPYTVTVGFLPQIWWYNTAGTAQVNASCGLFWRESGTGELHTFHIQKQAAQVIPGLCSFKWTSPTAFSALYLQQLLFLQTGPIVWLRLREDASNRECWVSWDGINFLKVHTIGRTDFLTADQVGFFVNAGNTAVDVGMTVLSWKETA